MTYKQPVLPSNEQLASIYDSFPGMVWLSGPDKRYTFFNANWLSFRGRTSEQETNGEWINDIHPDDQKKYRVAFEESGNSHLAFQIKYRLRRNDNEYRWLLTTAEPQVSSSGVFLGYVASSVDIHELTEEMILGGEFISSASHELKIPVTTIKVYAQLLEDFFEREGDERHVGFLQKVNKQVVKLTRLINNLAESNELYQCRMNLMKSEFDLNKMIMEEISRVQSESFKHNILFEGYSTQNVYGDRERLAQAFANLLDNAIKFSPDSDTIKVCLMEDQQSVAVSVRDFGIGINDKERNKIFRRFYRGHENITNTFPGVGLGLYISSQIIKEHGGEIVFEPAEPGSNFKFMLPYDNRNKHGK